MTDTRDSEFREGQPIWVVGANGEQRPAEHVGLGQTSAWLGGPPTVFVVYLDTKTGDAVDAERVIHRRD